MNKDDLLMLTGPQLIELVGRLAEAEVRAAGGQVDGVYSDLKNSTKEKGVDLRVTVDESNFRPGVIPRPNTLFRCKTTKLRPSCIKREMLKDGTLLPIIARQAHIKGGFVIVSPGDDCSETMHGVRLGAMTEAIGNHGNIHVGFIDRSGLHQWISRHPGAMKQGGHN